VSTGPLFRRGVIACRACGVEFEADDGRGRRYCARCRAVICGECSRRGGRHRSTCSRRRPRRCRACRTPLAPAEIATAPRAVRYCTPCRQARRAPRLRPALPYRGVVSEADLLDVYARIWGPAVRIAARFCGRDAEDVVQDVALYLWLRRDTLTAISPGFFVESVKRKAIQRDGTAWRRHAVLAGASVEDLGEVEGNDSHP
jgi:hypothetical protein